MHQKMIDGQEFLYGLLAQYFRNYYYKDAIEKIRLAVQEEAKKTRWEAAKEVISQRAIYPEAALAFFDKAANLPLEDNTDEEVYRWLDLFVANVDEVNQAIIAY